MAGALLLRILNAAGDSFAEKHLLGDRGARATLQRQIVHQ
jgi:hypothetical protein